MNLFKLLSRLFKSADGEEEKSSQYKKSNVSGSKRGYRGRWKSKKTSSNIDYDAYVLKKSLFTPAERSFLGVLSTAVSDQYFVYGKTRIADVFDTKWKAGWGAWRSSFNRISSKHFDYVLCDKNTLSFIAAIELDDKSHRKAKVVQRDMLVEGICKSAGLTLIRFDVKASYQIQVVRDTIFKALNSSESTVVEFPKAVSSN